MANSFLYKEKNFRVGDTLTIEYKIKEAEKERIQPFKGILIKIRGINHNNRTITLRKISQVGIGVEKIFPLSSPNISDIKLNKKTPYSNRAKLYFIRKLSEAELRRKLYRKK